MFRTRGMRAEELEAGYWRAYRDFYRWGSIFRGAATKPEWRGRLRHFAYAAGWKKFEPLWDVVIRARRVAQMLPVLETVLGSGGGDAEPAPASLHGAERVGVDLYSWKRGSCSRGPPVGGHRPTTCDVDLAVHDARREPTAGSGKIGTLGPTAAGGIIDLHDGQGSQVARPLHLRRSLCGAYCAAHHIDPSVDDTA